MTSRPLTKAEFRDLWERARLEVFDLRERAIAIESLLPRLYEGVLCEPAPERAEIIEARRTGVAS